MAPRDPLGWTLDDYRALVDAAAAQGIPPEWMAAIMYRESDMNPRALNALGFRGLIQFSTQNLHDFGLTDAQIAAFTSRTPAEQMRYVSRFYKHWRPSDGWASRAQLYQATYMPGTIKWKGSDPVTVLAKKGQPEYDFNTNLDPTGKGYVTVGDLETDIQARLDRSDSQWPVALAGIVAAGGPVASNEIGPLQQAGYITREESAIGVYQTSTAPAMLAVAAGAGLLAYGAYVASRASARPVARV